jgi:hypothetical protein
MRIGLDERDWRPRWIACITECEAGRTRSGEVALPAQQARAAPLLGGHRRWRRLIGVVRLHTRCVG